MSSFKINKVIPNPLKNLRPCIEQYQRKAESHHRHRASFDTRIVKINIEQDLSE